MSLVVVVQKYLTHARDPCLTSKDKRVSLHFIFTHEKHDEKGKVCLGVTTDPTSLACDDHLWPSTHLRCQCPPNLAPNYFIPNFFIPFVLISIPFCKNTAQRNVAFCSSQHCKQLDTCIHLCPGVVRVPSHHHCAGAISPGLYRPVPCCCTLEDHRLLPAGTGTTSQSGCFFFHTFLALTVIYSCSPEGDAISCPP